LLTIGIDALADKIAILALGRLRAVGDSLHLKKRFGAGYHVNITTAPEHADHIKEFVSGVLPGMNHSLSGFGWTTNGNFPNRGQVGPRELRSTRLLLADGISN